MATVTMDISELKLMEENKALLEKALKREEELKKTLKALHQEKEDAIKDKLKAYEAAKMSVAYIKRVTTTEHRVKSDTFDMDNRSISEEFTRHFHQFADPAALDRFIGMIFKKHDKKIKSVDESEDVEYKGFDEVRGEIQRELEANITKSTKDKVANYNKLSKEFVELKKSYESLEEMCDHLQKKLEEEKAQNEKLGKYFDDASNGRSKLTTALVKIQNRVNDRGIFNKGEILDDILIYIKQAE